MQILKNRFLIVAGMALCTLLAYSPFLHSPFRTLDDDFSIVQNEKIRDFRNIPSFFQSTYFGQRDYYRPLVYVTYTIEYRLFGLNSFFYNLDNVLLHILNALLVLVLTGLILKRFDVSNIQTLSAWSAFLFAIHPIHWEAVTNVSGRAILLCAFFVLSALIFFLRALNKQSIKWLAASVACYIFGLLSKESAGVVVLTAGALLVVLRKQGVQDKNRMKQDALTLLPFVLVAAGYIILRKQAGIASVFPWPSVQDMALGFITFLKGLFIYAQLMIFPVGLYFDRGLRLFSRLSDPGVVATMSAWIAIGLSVFRFRRKLSPLSMFLMFWALAELLPVSQILTSIGVYKGAISLADHFMYVASIPVIIGIVLGVQRMFKRLVEARMITALIPGITSAGFVAFLLLITMRQAVIGSNEYVMVKDTLMHDPRNARALTSLGMVYVRMNKFELAGEQFLAASKIEPEKMKYRIAYAKTLADNGDLLAAAKVYESIPPELTSERALLEENKRLTYELLVKDYEWKVKVNPGDPELHFALGVFYWKLNNAAQAEEEFCRTVELDANHYDARYNVAVLSDMRGDQSAARAAYKVLAESTAPQNRFRLMATQRLMELGEKN